MLQSTFFDPVLGVDTHIVLVPTPAGPVPTPVPMPFVGMVFDPAGLAIGAAIGMATGGGPGLVLVNSMPVTNAGTNVTNTLTMPHLPVPGVAFAKGLPGNDAELFFGSLNVNLAGSLGVRLGEIAMSCSDPVRLPTSVVLAIPKGMPVLNMPAPVPDLAGIAQRLVMLGAMKLLRAVARGGARLFRALRAAQRRSRGWQRFSRALKGAVDRIAPQRFRDRLKRAVCFVTGHPVDVATGRVFTDNIDFELPGPLPLVFERVYSSSLSWRNGPLGYGWSHSLDQQVWLEPGKVVLLAEDGREIEFHTDGLSDRRLRTGQTLFDATQGMTVRALGSSCWEIEQEDGRVHEFAPVPGGPRDRARLMRIRSRDGHHVIQLSYDARGRLDFVRDSAGRLLGFEHDESGRLMAVKLPLASAKESGWYNHLRYVYGPRGDLVKVMDAAGSSWQYDYQGHLLVQETDRTGLSFFFQYDGLGSSARCVRTWGDGGIYDHLITYDVQNRKTVVEDSLGAVTVYQMDELGMVVKVVDPHGAATTYAYDENCGKRIRETNAAGQTWETTYGSRGDIITSQEPDGAKVCWEYDARGFPVRATDALGGAWTWDYDVEGHLVEQVTPTGERTGWGWKQGLMVWVEAPGGRRFTLEYDKQKNVALKRAPTGAALEYEYDGLGRIRRVKDARGAIRHLRYDVLGRWVRAESPIGLVQEFAYDAEGNLLEVHDATQHVRLTYGHFHKVVKREEAGTSMRFHYDTEGRLTGVFNEADEAYTFVRDACGRTLEETGFDGRTRRFERDKVGRVECIHEPSGRKTQLQYDAGGRVAKVVNSDGTGVEFVYRADGTLVRAKNESAVVVLERDAVGRVVREVQGDFSLSSRFDTSGQRSLLESSLGGRMAMLRDALGNVSALHLGRESHRSQQPTVRFERDPQGLEVARQLPGNIRVEWQRDVVGRPTARRTLRRGAGSSAVKLGEQAYEWQGADQLTAITDSRRGAVSYEYDARGRLVAQRGKTGTVHRAMDAVGNVYRTPSGRDRRYGPGGWLEEADGARYLHDEDGNLTERRDADGARWRYRWNGAGLLSEVERPDGKRVRFEYDAFARRTRKAQSSIGADGRETLESETRFVWDGDTLLHEVSTGAPVTTWYWEPDSFTPVVKEQAGHRWGIASDHLGTPTEMFDEAGRPVWAMRLDIVGSPTFELGTAEACPWRWPGQYEDAEDGLYYQRWRPFDPRLHLFLRKDPLGLRGGFNAFQYTESPLAQVDPLGLAPLVVIGEGQDRIKPVATSLGAHDISTVWDWHDKPYMRQNRRWIQQQISERAVFVDLGRDGRPNPSHFYSMEIDELTKAGYTRMENVSSVKGVHGNKVSVPKGSTLWFPPRNCT
ncbi:MAG: DUF6531 domain-containing protein [Hyalangium sp.]|uniref:DUF6531 domain-containing protein n=1 Tax=Hyalangium sp. TaxID=2028555 RepID=UPI00389A1978